jgi:hypothetical protein
MNYISIFSAACFFGCGGRKEVAAEVREAVVAEWRRTDSLRMERMAWEWATRTLEVSHVTFDLLDSSGRQAVSSVTRITAKEEAGGETSSSLSAESETVGKVVADREAIRTEVVKKSIPVLRIALIAAGCGLMSGIFFCLRKRN